jgi:hypothetical protein
MTGSLVKLPAEHIEQAIYVVRGEKVMLDRNLAALYGVPTKVLKQAVRRNLDRFLDDFMFVLNKNEFESWRSQFVTSRADRKGLRYPPMAFTEQGVAMLSSVLNSERAVRVNIEIMRTFVRLRQMLASNVELARKLADLEKKYDHQFKVVFDAIRELMTPPKSKRKGNRISGNAGEGLPSSLKVVPACFRSSRSSTGVTKEWDCLRPDRLTTNAYR